MDSISSVVEVSKQRKSRRLKEQWTRVISFSAGDDQLAKGYVLDTDLEISNSIDKTVPKNKVGKWKLVFNPKEFLL